MADIEYNFEDSEKPEDPQEDPRTNLRITRCCSNCKFYRKKAPNSHRGYCMYPDPKSKQPRKLFGESFDDEDMRQNWLHSHNSCLCDLYQLKSKRIDIDIPGEWIGKHFLNDGTVKEE